MKFEHPDPKNDKRHQIGEGVWKRAYHLPEDTESTTLEFKDTDYSDEQVRGLFYYQKLIHLLFPNETVDVYQVGNKCEGEEKRAYARTEFVSHEDDEVHRKLQSGYAHGEDMSEEELFFFKEALRRNSADVVSENFLDSAIKSGVWHRLDPYGPQDSIRTKEGIKYVDLHFPWIEWKDNEGNPVSKEMLFYPDLLRTAIQALPQDSREQGEVYFERLMNLFNSRTLKDVSDLKNTPKTREELEKERF